MKKLKNILLINWLYFSKDMPYLLMKSSVALNFT